MFDDQIVQDQGIACGTDTETFGGKVDGKSERFGPLCVCVGESNDLIRPSGMFSCAIARTHLVLEPLDTSPSAQYKRIVGCDHGDHIDTFLYELIIVLEIGREVVHMAGRLSGQSAGQDDRTRSVAYGECTRNGKHDDLLSSPLFGDRVGGD